MALQFPDFDPVAVAIPAIHLGSVVLGPFAVRWYALAYIAGILLGWRYCVGMIRNQRLWGGRAPTITAPQIDDLIRRDDFEALKAEVAALRAELAKLKPAGEA